MAAYKNWDWLVPGRLAQGAYPGTHPGLFNAFDVVVYTADEHQPKGFKPPPGKFVYKIGLDDDIYRPISKEMATNVHRMGQGLAGHLRAGHKVLVTCAMGFNRSGIVSAATLIHFMGCSGSQAADIIQQRRRSSPDGLGPLSNPIFERWVRTHGHPGA